MMKPSFHFFFLHNSSHQSNELTFAFAWANDFHSGTVCFRGNATVLYTHCIRPRSSECWGYFSIVPFTHVFVNNTFYLLNLAAFYSSRCLYGSQFSTAKENRYFYANVMMIEWRLLFKIRIRSSVMPPYVSICCPWLSIVRAMFSCQNG